MNLFSRKLGKAVELKDIVDKGTWAEYNLAEDEARFLLAQTEKGVLTPNLFNMLVGTSRAGRQSNNRSKIVQTWMGLFSNTERFNRRTTALASYRLEKRRMMEAGISEADIVSDKTNAHSELYERAVTAVNSSQGEYALYNRPAWARSGLGKMLYTYKQFVVITIELMRNLSPEHRTLFLAGIVLMSGLKGLPFADDTADIIDTLMQKFGIASEGVEANIAQLADALVPGMSPVLMRGVLDHWLGTTASTRLGHGDLIPGTGAFRAGADVGRELVNIFGPVASAVSGIVGGAAISAQYAAEVAGLREDTISLKDVARQGFGSSAIRGATEGLIYASDGSITNDRGQIVSNDVGARDVLFRMMGFYPGVATKHNDIVRMSKHADEYLKEIKASFLDGIRRATAAGDRAEVARIKADVQRWNRDVGKSLFYIRDFGQSATKAVREGKRTTAARYLKSAPRSVRPFTADLMRIYGFDSKGISLTEGE